MNRTTKYLNEISGKLTSTTKQMDVCREPDKRTGIFRRLMEVQFTSQNHPEN